mgnify:CR=1 FL=1
MKKELKNKIAKKGELSNVNEILIERMKEIEKKEYKGLATNHYEMGFDLLVIRMALFNWLNKYPIHRICKQDYIPLAKGLCEIERHVQEYSLLAGSDFKKIIEDIKAKKKNNKKQS